MKEIGGYFELEQLIRNEYYNDLIPLNNGRSALLYILKAKKIKKIYIPYFLCNSVSDLLRREGFDFEYYNIDSEFKPVFNKSLASHEYLYIVNYYGQFNNNYVIQLKKQYHQIILDNTHAFFQRPIDNIDTFYTCRKYFGVPDGAYLSTEVTLKDDLEIDISKDRMIHILGRYEGIASDYYFDFQNNNKRFKNEKLKHMSKLTHNILGAIDYDKVIKIRNSNYAYLDIKLSVYNKLKLTVPVGAFAYPFYIENGIEIRRTLAQKNIYIPTLWPNVIKENVHDSIEHKYASNILPIPCDQRYGIDEMQYIINCIFEEV